MDYNPHAPKIAGVEWVPIREETLEFNPHINSFERGYGFMLGTTRRVDSVRAYVQEYPDYYLRNRIFQANIYEQGKEDQSGPIQSVIIPCDNGGITGSGISLGGSATVAGALQNASSVTYIQIQVGGPNGYNRLSVHFNVNDYANVLIGKRILGVNLLLGVDVGLFANSSQAALTMWVASDAAIINGPNAESSGNAVNYGQPIDPDTPITDLRLDRVPIGGVNRFPSNSYSYSNHFDLVPWTFGELSRFEASTAAPARLCMLLTSNAVGSSFDDVTTALITYAAMEVFYCEEARTAYGYRIYMADDTGIAESQPINIGALPIYLKTAITHTSQPALIPGNYTVTLSEENLGFERETLATGTVLVPFNELRQIAPIPSLPATQINIPYPLEDSVGQLLTSETVQVIPQLTLHTSGGTMYECHPYGVQSIAQVYGSVEPNQEIYVPETADWAWARFYARRHGDTSVPLKLTESSTGQFEIITPEDFDALDEIVDGFREVNMEFDPPLSLIIGSIPSFTWSATGEQIGSRWEVLGAGALAITGMPGNRMSPVAAPNTLGTATYFPPAFGSIVNLAWLPQNGPYVSAVTDDASSDAVLILGQDMQPITGFSVAVTSQAVSGIGQNCGIDPCGIPTHILYNELTWPLPVNTSYAADSFDRTVVNGLGTATTGETYTLLEANTQYQVADGKATITPTVLNSFIGALLSNQGSNFDITITIENNGTVASGTIAGGLFGRYTDSSNYYYATVSVQSTGATIIGILKSVAGVVSIVGELRTFSTGIYLTPGIGSAVRFRFAGNGTYLKAKAWKVDKPEPTQWLVEAEDISLTTGTMAGFFAQATTATAGKVISFRDFVITPPSYWFGFYELQRSDEVETDWHTIMQATGPETTSFNDFEARTGVESYYRIRPVDISYFPGTWSETVTSTIPTPGVSGDCLDDGSHVLIFTTNEHQDGSSNLAYSSVWMDSQITENFSFPEASFVQLQAMYDRDYFIAFHPSERGGDQFSRAVLVQAAAIAPETLADFSGLRNMAWTSVPYVCVRDEEGNRWFASISVPTGTVVNRRKIYVAQVNIAEVTTTPSPVDPS